MQVGAWLLVVIVSLIVPFQPAQAQIAKCPDGYQPYQKDSNRCISQRMADYVSCVESSGGNHEMVTDEIQKSQGAKTGGAASGEGGGPFVHGGGGVVVDRQAEQAIARRLQKRWYSDSMAECRKVLSLPEPKSKPAGKSKSNPQDLTFRSLPSEAAEIEIRGSSESTASWHDYLVFVDLKDPVRLPMAAGGVVKMSAGHHDVFVQIATGEKITKLLSTLMLNIFDDFGIASRLTRSNVVSFDIAAGQAIKLAVVQQRDALSGTLQITSLSP